MNKQQEKVLVATLCGFVIAAVAGFAVQPAVAAGYGVDQLARVTGIAEWDHLNVRKWPAAYSRKVGAFPADTPVWVDRCIEMPAGADWCLVDRAGLKGWVNATFLRLAGDDWDI